MNLSSLSNTKFFSANADKQKSKKDFYYFNKKTNGYFSKSTHKRITNKQLYKEVAKSLARYEKKVSKLTNRFISGNLSFEQWQKGMMSNIKSAHVNMYRFGKGGADQTFANDYLVLARDLKSLHYAKLKKLAQEIKKGQHSYSAILHRARGYVRSSKTAFSKGQIARHPDKLYLGRRKLGSCRDRCSPCIDYASMGWIKPSLLTPIGVNCDCLFEDCCSMEFKEV